MKKTVVLLWLALAGLFMVGTYSACTDFTTIGSDLLEEDRLGLDFVDTITLVTTTVIQDSILTYSGTNFAAQLDRFLFGDFTDPILGRVQAGIYVQALLDRDRTGFFAVPRLPNFRDATLDSIVLVLTLDSASFYGAPAPAQPFGVEVFRVTEDMDASKNYYSNVSFATQAFALGSAQFFPVLDSIRVIDFTNATPDTLSYPHLRIRLNPALGNELIHLDSLSYLDDTTFIRAFKGLYIKPTQSTDGLVAFNWRSLRPGIFIYYTNNVGLPRQYQFEINELSARVSRFQHDYTGARVAPYLNNPSRGDTLLFIQGMSGVNTKIEFPHIAALRGAIVNYAELEIPLGALPNDDPVRYPPAVEVLLRVPNSDGVLESISDITLSGNNRASLFGGALIKGTNGKPDVYRMNVSSQIADMINGRAPNVMYLQVIAKAQSGRRSVLKGPKNPENRMRLKVAFTKT